MEKFILAMGMMLFSLIVRDLFVSISVFIISSTVILAAKIPWKYYFTLLLLPMTFLLAGTFPIMINVTDSMTVIDGVVWNFYVDQLQIYFSDSSIKTAAQLFVVSFSGVSCLYLLILTTPFVEILYLLNRLKISPLFIELVAFTYRFIFIFLDTSREIYQAQASRFGYHSFRNSIQSLGLLVSALMLKSFQKAKQLHIAVESRGGYGDFTVIEKNYTVSIRNWGFILITFSYLFFLFVFHGGL